MKLCLSQIRKITTGAARVEESKDGICFRRFTSEQEELYKNRSEDFYKKTFATSGTRLQFRTNSQTLFLKAEVGWGSYRSFFSFDVFVDGKKVDSLDNFSDKQLSSDYAKIVLPLGEFSKKFYLGDGDKNICIYLPWSVSVVLKELSLDDNSIIEPQKPSKKLLSFGDSITQGYDALYPSNKYVTKLANMLDAEEYNKGIGGETFFPELAATKEAFEPDYITVAYGSNDWSKCTKEAFIQNCKKFFSNLVENYPNSKIFVITPIWRGDMNETKVFGKFESVSAMIQEYAGCYSNISVIHGFDFVPQNEKLFADLRLHPNDNGYEYYYENLSKRVKALL